MRNTVVSMLLAALVCGAGARSAWAQAGDNPPPARQDQGLVSLGAGDATFDPNQAIKPGFTLSVTVSSPAGQEADLSGVFPVDPSGAIQMKLVGRVEVRGLTPSQASDKIAGLLKPFVKEPKAQVSIISVPKPVVFLSGGVTRAGAVNVNDGTTLSEVLTVYGFSDNADLTKVRVVHRDETGKRTYSTYDFTRWLKPLPGLQPDEAQNPVLSDRDLVYVPLKTLPSSGNVSIEGEVAKPGLVPIRFGVPTRLREAISMAGDALPTADEHLIEIRRFGVDKPIIVDYEKVEANDPANNIVLQADDIVYIPKLSYQQFVNLNGAFVRNGKLAFQHEMTLTQAIGDAGGLQLNAKEKEGRIFRHPGGTSDPTRTQVIAFNYKDIRQSKRPDILLQPGDTVEMPLSNPPNRVDPLTLTSQILTIAVLVDRLSRGSGF